MVDDGVRRVDPGAVQKVPDMGVGVHLTDHRPVRGADYVHAGEIRSHRLAGADGEFGFLAVWLMAGQSPADGRV